MAIEYVDSTRLDSDLTSVANAIRTKGGTSAQLAFPQGFVDAVEAIETGGGGWSIDDITRYAGITGNIEITNASVGDYCLYGRTGITGLSLPNVVTGAQYAWAVTVPNGYLATQEYVQNAISDSVALINDIITSGGSNT